jgi:Bax protein
MKVVALTLFLLLSHDVELTHQQIPSAVPEVKPLVRPIPDFAGYTNVQKKKSDFFNYMLPIIRAGNAQVRSERLSLQTLIHHLKNNQSLTPSEAKVATDLFRRYKMAVPENMTLPSLTVLLSRIDVVPEALVLAQSANESGWGTSRFARKANNFFGIWCFRAGCGLAPLGRDSGQTHEVAKYDSVLNGVQAYLRVLNTHPAYETLRNIRSQQRQYGTLRGEALAEGLTPYSERGVDYVRDIQQLIRVNDLQTFTSV